MRRWLFVLVLIVMAPLVAEVFSGSTPITQPGLFLVDLLIYGPGALLIRELARRCQRGWASILLLGVAYGFIEEGLALQSLFDPHYGTVALWGARIFGVKWVYTSVVITWIHPVWSVAIPIALTELLFPVLFPIDLVEGDFIELPVGPLLLPQKLERGQIDIPIE